MSSSGESIMLMAVQTGKSVFVYYLLEVCSVMELLMSGMSHAKRDLGGIGKQDRPRSACTFVQADLGLCCLLIE